MTPASLEAGIARLERSLRRQRLIGGAALVALAVVMLSARERGEHAVIGRP